MKTSLPTRLVRMMQGEIDVDVAKRTLNRCVVTTRGIASDGGIVMPEGIDTSAFEQNAVVLSMHGMTGKFPVIGRALSIGRDSRGVWTATRFADTEDGRDLAYLYGVNDEKEVFARAWSFGWETLEVEEWTVDRARQWLGGEFDEKTLPMWVKRSGVVWVAVRSRMQEYSAVAVGADRNALTRAMNDKNVRLAAELLADMDLIEARTMLSTLEYREMSAKVQRLERELKALLSDGASAAKRGDTEAIRAEITDWVRKLQTRG